MRSVAFILLFVPLFFSACKKDRTPDAPTKPTGTNYRIKKTRVATMSNIISDHYEYNAAGYLVKLTHEDSFQVQTPNKGVAITTYEFTYDAKNRLTQYILNGTNTVTGIYHYDGNNRLQFIKQHFKNNALQNYYEFVWDKGKIIKIIDRMHDGSLGYTHFITYDANGNVSKVDRSTLSDSTKIFPKHSNIQYDNKPNYLNTIKGMEGFIPFAFDYPQMLSNNNVTAKVFTFDDGSTHASAYNWVYNAAGYLESGVYSGGTITYNYYYELY